MAWQVHCKHCHHVFTIMPEIVASEHRPAQSTLTVTCPKCDHTEEYKAADVGHFDLAQAS